MLTKSLERVVNGEHPRARVEKRDDINVLLGRKCSSVRDRRKLKQCFYYIIPVGDEGGNCHKHEATDMLVNYHNHVLMWLSAERSLKDWVLSRKDGVRTYRVSTS